MKKTITALMLVMLTGTGFAQKNVVSAYNLMKDGEFLEASEFIEKAMDNPNATEKEKTWRYRGQIYLSIALDSGLFVQKPNALQLAKESYLKARELDEKNRYEREITLGLNNVRDHSLNTGVAEYNVGNYEKAANRFALSNEVTQEAFDSTFTLAIYNAALAYEKAGSIDEAINYYEKCAEVNYQVPGVYILIANLLKNQDKEEQALQVLRDAREQFPKDRGLILEELNIYLVNKEYDRAKDNLELAVEADPNNEVLHFSRGAVLDELGEDEQAEKSYLRAIEIKPDYTDALYNLGALYYNTGAEKVNEANEIPPTKTKEYEAAMGKAKEYFTKAQPYFEQALELSPDDVAIMQSLKNIYARTGQDAKMLEMTNRLKGK